VIYLLAQTKFQQELPATQSSNRNSTSLSTTSNKPHQPAQTTILTQTLVQMQFQHNQQHNPATEIQCHYIITSNKPHLPAQIQL